MLLKPLLNFEGKKRKKKEEEKGEFVCFIGNQNEILFKQIHSIFIALVVWGNLIPCFFYLSQKYDLLKKFAKASDGICSVTKM